MTRTLVLAPFVCPVCAAPNAVHLITVSQARGAACVSCRKWLTSQDIMRARISPRAEQPLNGPAPPSRA
ncbi:MAG TPA: hypothetical protein VHH36_05470 [Candidatus Thermoplasmatota archaeon]|nr:hypothetical protein [Candidatus Thermoplasmatota archaeon]